MRVELPNLARGQRDFRCCWTASDRMVRAGESKRRELWRHRRKQVRALLRRSDYVCLFHGSICGVYCMLPLPG